MYHINYVSVYSEDEKNLNENDDAARNLTVLLVKRFLKFFLNHKKKLNKEVFEPNNSEISFSTSFPF